MDRQEILRRFHEDGFVVIEGVLDRARDMQPLMDDYAALLDALARRWYAAAAISSLYAGLPFNRRFALVAQEAGAAGVNWIQHFDFSLPQAGVKEDTPIHLSEAVFNLLRNPRLLDVAEMVIGPEIVVNPIHHVRLKPPEGLVPESMRGGLTARTAWHQDLGVALPEADDTDILTIWLPMADVSEENGCLCAVAGSHHGELATHCPGTGADTQLHIPDSLLGGKPVPLPMKQGSLVALHRLTKHSSLSNNSDDIRWSFDLRYQPAGKATGRPAFPAFLARSRAHPERVLTDWREWAANWQEARAALALGQQPVFNRWSSSAPVCA